MFPHPHRWSFPRTPRGERGLVPDRSRPALARTVARASVRAISRWAPSLLDRAGRYAPYHACGGPSRPRKAIRRAPTSGRTRCARHRPRRHINHRRRPRRAIRQRDIARRLLSASTGRLKRPRRPEASAPSGDRGYGRSRGDNPGGNPGAAGASQPGHRSEPERQAPGGGAVDRGPRGGDAARPERGNPGAGGGARERSSEGRSTGQARSRR
jgi:hypothetical protein